MKKYTVTHGQNIYDIAVTLYGSIEGIFDLLANNEGISINEEIEVGTVLQYDETFEINPQVTQWLEDNNIVIANGDPSFDISGIDLSTLRIVINQKGATSVLTFALLSGTICIDWGDGSRIDTVSNTTETTFDHPYLEDGQHTIRIYGDFQFQHLDLTEINGIYYAVSKCKVPGTFKESTNRTDLKTLFT